MLTPKEIEHNATPKDRPWKLADGKGLYLLINPNGSKLWRYKYRFGGKERLLALGSYPDTKLAEARKTRDNAREALDDGRDPGAERRIEKAARAVAQANSFEDVAREWHRNQVPGWTPRHAHNVLLRMEADLFPDLGRRPLADITLVDLLAVIRKIERRSPEMAHRAYQSAGLVFRYGIATGRCDRNIAADLRGALQKKSKGKNHPALKADGLKGFYKNLKKLDTHPGVPLAIRLLMLTAVRSGELIGMRWDEIKGANWTIPASRMKMDADHVVPLSKQAQAILKSLRSISGAYEFVFASPVDPTKPMGHKTLLAAFHAMGYRGVASPHGMRALFSTTMNERGYHADVIERQLAHIPGGVRAAYNKAQWLPDRQRMLQDWGDYLVKAER